MVICKGGRVPGKLYLLLKQVADTNALLIVSSKEQKDCYLSYAEQYGFSIKTPMTPAEFKETYYASKDCKGNKPK